MLVSDQTRIRHLLWEATYPAVPKSVPIQQTGNLLNSSSVPTEPKLQLIWDTKKRELFGDLLDRPKQMTNVCPSCPFVSPRASHQIANFQQDRLPPLQLYTASFTDKKKHAYFSDDKFLNSDKSNSNRLLSMGSFDSLDFGSVKVLETSDSDNPLEHLRLIPFPNKRLSCSTPAYTTVSFNHFLKSKFRNNSDSQISSLILRHPGAQIICTHPVFSEWLNQLPTQHLLNHMTQTALKSKKSQKGAIGTAPHSGVWDFRHSPPPAPIFTASPYRSAPDLPAFRVVLVETIYIIDASPWISKTPKSQIIQVGCQSESQCSGFFSRTTGSFRCSSSSPISSTIKIKFDSMDTPLRNWALSEWTLSPFASWDLILDPTDDFVESHSELIRCGSNDSGRSNDLGQRKVGQTESFDQISNAPKRRESIKKSDEINNISISLVPLANAFTILTYQFESVPNVEVVRPINATFRMTSTPGPSKSQSIFHISVQLHILKSCLSQFIFLRIRLPILQTCHFSRAAQRQHALSQTIGSIKFVSKGRVMIWDIEPSELESFSKFSDSRPSDSKLNRSVISLNGDVEIESKRRQTPIVFSDLNQISRSEMSTGEMSQNVLSLQIDSVPLTEQPNEFLSDQLSTNHLNSRLPPLLPVEFNVPSVCEVPMSFVELSYCISGHSVTGMVFDHVPNECPNKCAT